MHETERAIAKILTKKGHAQPEQQASRARTAMELAFEDAMVTDYERMLCVCPSLPDADDAHVVAAALYTQASIIVTENVSDFPESLLEPLNIEVRTADNFIADTILLDAGRAVAAIRTMRLRFNRPEIDVDNFLVSMEAAGLLATVDALRPHRDSL